MELLFDLDFLNEAVNLVVGTVTVIAGVLEISEKRTNKDEKEKKLALLQK